MRPHTKTVSIEDRQTRAISLCLEGHSYSQIGAALGVDKATICRDIQAARAEWRASREEQTEAHIAKELARIESREREAWEAWRRSTGTKERTKVKAGPDGDTTETTTWEEAGDASFLAAIAQCSEQRRKLLGLDSPTKHQEQPPEYQYRSREELLARNRARLAALGFPMPDESSPPRLVSN